MAYSKGKAALRKLLDKCKIPYYKGTLECDETPAPMTVQEIQAALAPYAEQALVSLQK